MLPKTRVTLTVDPALVDKLDGKARDASVSRSRALEIALSEHFGVPTPEPYAVAVEGSHGGNPGKRKPIVPSAARAASGESDEGEPASELEDDSQPASSQPDASPQRPAARGSEEPKKDDEPEEVP